MGFETLRWIGGTDGRLALTNQRLLPGRLETLYCETVEQLYEAIQTLAVRGAPAIGVAAAYGVCLAAQRISDVSLPETAIEQIGRGCDDLARSRPTAVNLFWALDRMRQTAVGFVRTHPDAQAGSLRACLLAEAHAICAEDKAMCEAIGQHGVSLIPDGGAVLTHCNAGALATAGIGTALAPMYVAHRIGKRFTVYVDETRPLLQGARLTAWELTQGGIDAVLVCDNMAASLMAAGRVDAVITGADRIAANGDAANKIGTLGLSILAKHYQIPFYIAAPSSTFDANLPDGSHIPIEHRGSEEVRGFGENAVAPAGINVYNPAFDVTPAANITAIITEKGIIEHPNTEKITRRLKFRLALP
jgi:methylthioribose-1-phosphate isomerase